MKKLLFILSFILLSASTFAQIGYKPMNGYYEFNGNLRMSDTLFVKTSAINVTGDNTVLRLDTTGSAVSGYYRIIASSAGSLKGEGTAAQVAVFGATDSLYTTPLLTVDTTNSSLGIRSNSGNATLTVRQADTTLTLSSQSVSSNASGSSVQSIDFNTNGEMEFKTHNLFSKMTLGDTYAMTINADTNTTFNIVEPELVAAGANTATFTNAPVAGNAIFYLKVRLIIGGTPIEVVIPMLKAP